MSDAMVLALLIGALIGGLAGYAYGYMKGCEHVVRLWEKESPHE
jgi:membrane protein DedA with SNARE-associated domain